MFLGIIRPYTGSGKKGSKSVTFQEYEAARKHNKPAWYIVDKRVQFAKSLAIILEYLSKNEMVKSDKLAEITGKSYPTIKRYTQILKEANLIYYKGNARTGGWNLKL